MCGLNNSADMVYFINSIIYETVSLDRLGLLNKFNYQKYNLVFFTVSAEKMEAGTGFYHEEVQ